MKTWVMEHFKSAVAALMAIGAGISEAIQQIIDFIQL